MKLFILSFLLCLAACSKSGSGTAPGGSGGHVADTTPHDYAVGFTVLADYGVAHDVTFHQICNFGFAGTRDETASFSESAAGLGGAIGCGASHNYTVDISNTGTVLLNITVTIDGIYLPALDMVVLPGATSTFQRGY